nr:MAG TPA: hypothetical protein [Caudoviricetes sp.]
MHTSSRVNLDILHKVEVHRGTFSTLYALAAPLSHAKK